MGKKKIVYLSADFGSGHKSAVEAIKQGIDKHHPNEFEHEIIDVAGLLGSSIDKIAEVFYKNSVMYAKPTWKAFFEISDKVGTVDSDKRIYKVLKPLLKPIAEAKPDIVIACYPLMAYSVSRALKEEGVNVPFVCLVTDSGEVHINWVSQSIDHYFVQTKDTAFYLEERGIPKERISVFGFPVKQNFYDKYDPEKARKKYDIPKGNKVILYFTGAWGPGKVKDKLLALDEALDKTTILIVCGKNDRLKNGLNNVKYKNDIRALGFVDDMAEIFAPADLVISKAGGISVMELITCKKPIVITEINPGQEEPNARFIESMGFGYVEKKAKGLAEKVKYIFEYNDLERLKFNLNNYHLNDNSDKKIADYIVNLVEKNTDEHEHEGYFHRIIHHLR